MKRIVLFALLAVSWFPLSAAPITVSKSIVLDRQLERVWRWTGGFCSIRVWHPAVEACDFTKKGDEEFRILTLKDGAQITEKYVGGKAYGYSYTMTETPLPVKGYSASFEAEQVDGKVKFTWAAKFSADGVSDEEARDVITGVINGGLESIQTRYGKKAKKEKQAE